jgi:hypothetical protein
MKISLIHPSRGRAKKSFYNAKEWIENAGCEVELILSLDNNDITGLYADLYEPLFQQYNGKFICRDNNSVVEATNKAAKESTGDILAYLSDDFKAPDNWGQLILKEFEGVTEPMLLHVDDCLQPMHARVLTIPIMNRQLYNKLGYFFHPEYKSMFVDCDLYETADRLKAIKKAPHLKFPHEHVSIGKAPDDETYRNSAKNWDQGKAVFAKRKAAGFPA